MAENALAIQANRLTVVDPRNGSDVHWWAMAKEQAGMLVKTGFLPDSIRTPEQAVAIMLKGRELGIPSMYALSNIVVIKGKPTCNAELMLALIYRDHGDHAMRVVDSTNERCLIAYRRKGWADEQEHQFTAQDAQRAGLMTTDTWKKYTAAMLRARCISAVARMAFPDSIAGMYTPEELGATVDIADGDAVVSAPIRADGETGEIFEGEIVETGELPARTRTTSVNTVRDEPDDPPEMVRRDQLDRIEALMAQKGLTGEGVRKLHGHTSAKWMTVDEADKLIITISDYPDAVTAQAQMMPNGPDRTTA